MTAIKNMIAASMDVVAAEAKLSAETLTWLEASTMALEMGTTIASRAPIETTAELAVALAFQTLAEQFAERHRRAAALLATSRADMPPEPSGFGGASLDDLSTETDDPSREEG